MRSLSHDVDFFPFFFFNAVEAVVSAFKVVEVVMLPDLANTNAEFPQKV